MNEKLKRAKTIDKFMTGVFYGLAIFFIVLLVAFAGKVIIGGLLGATPEMFAFKRSGSVGNQLFNTIYLVFISLIVSESVFLIDPKGNVLKRIQIRNSLQEDEELIINTNHAMSTIRLYYNALHQSLLCTVKDRSTTPSS